MVCCPLLHFIFVIEVKIFGLFNELLIPHLTTQGAVLYLFCSDVCEINQITVIKYVKFCKLSNANNFIHLNAGRSVKSENLIVTLLSKNLRVVEKN